MPIAMGDDKRYWPMITDDPCPPRARPGGHRKQRRATLARRIQNRRKAMRAVAVWINSGDTMLRSWQREPIAAPKSMLPWWF